VISLRRAASVEDYRELARRRLPKMFFEYIDGGSYAEVTLKRNVEDFANLVLRQRVMRDMSDLDTSIETLGQRYRMPVGLSPVAWPGCTGGGARFKPHAPPHPGGSRSACRPWESAASRRWRARAFHRGFSSMS